MNFKITNDENDSIKLEIEFIIETWDELKMIMETIDDEFGVRNE